MPCMQLKVQGKHVASLESTNGEMHEELQHMQMALADQLQNIGEWKNRTLNTEQQVCILTSSRKLRGTLLNSMFRWRSFVLRLEIDH